MDKEKRTYARRHLVNHIQNAGMIPPDFYWCSGMEYTVGFYPTMAAAHEAAERNYKNETGEEIEIDFVEIAAGYWEAGGYSITHVVSFGDRY